MLSNEIMGVVGLAIVWVNTLLVLGAAWQDLRDLWAQRAESARVRKGVVTAASGNDGVVAVHNVEQVGRFAETNSERRVVFADRAHSTQWHGGTVTLESGEVLVLNEQHRRATVWVAPEAVQRAAACDGAEAFERAWKDGHKVRGYVRTVSVPVRVGDVVWCSAEGDGWISTIEPATSIAARVRWVWLLMAGSLVAASIATALALWPPVFGTVSMLGGALCLGYFLGVQPLGVLVRELVRPPSTAFVRGTWTSARSAPSVSVA